MEGLKGRSGPCRGLERGRAKSYKGRKRKRDINPLGSMHASTNKILYYPKVKKSQRDPEVTYDMNA